MDELIFTVDNLSDGEQVRVDKWISDNQSDLTRSMIQKLITEGGVTVNGKAVSKSCSVKNADNVTVIVPEPDRKSVV